MVFKDSKKTNNTPIIYIYMPGMNSPSGGIGVLLRAAKNLTDEGKEVHIVYEPRPNQQKSLEVSRKLQRQLVVCDEFNPTWIDFDISNVKITAIGDYSRIRLQDKDVTCKPVEICENDILIIPEGFPNVMKDTKDLNCSRVVFAQSWAYILSAMPPGQSWLDYNIKDVISVSDAITEFLNTTMPGLNIMEFKQGINTDIFKPLENKNKANPIVGFSATRGQENKMKVFTVIKMFYLMYPNLRNVQFKELVGLSREKFAEELSSCSFYLYTDEIAGFGTAPLEAMACNTHVVGWASYGGKEYMKPENGFWCANGDVVALATLLGETIGDYIKNDNEWKDTEELLINNYKVTLENYQLDKEKKYINDIIDGICSEILVGVPDYKILFKLPSRERPERVYEVLDATINNMSNNINFEFLLTLDEDDSTMNNKIVIDKLNSYPNMNIVFGKSESKIDAVNRDLNEYENNWDILVLLSDDMVPIKSDFDMIIRKAFKQYFPDLDGVTWFNDGFQKNKINTLCILGKEYYNRFNYIYHPSYKSLYCDNEFTEVANKLKKQKYFDTIIIEHRHFAIRDNRERYDKLYEKNESFIHRDAKVFRERKEKNFELPSNTMKKVISFSLYGNDPKYTEGMLYNLELIKELYPDWITYIYYNNTVPSDIMLRIKKYKNVEIKDMSDLKIPGMFWRFQPNDDKTVERFIVRDSDSRINVREVNAVNEWIEENKTLHIMRDHPHHSGDILGGMWGMVRQKNFNMKEAFLSYSNSTSLYERMSDMNFLSDIIYPKFVNDSTIHASYHKKESWAKNFPSPLIDRKFIGEIYNGDNSREWQYSLITE